MKPEAQPLVSVLTPVYNGEKYLAECIESVLAQTYQNWEYCIVNNCSTDRTLEVAQAYAAKDERIRVHNNSEFVGCDANGNIAFRQISVDSRYCKVVHADDWLFPECIERMVELAQKHPNVAIVGSYGLRNDRVAWDGLSYESAVISGREICKSILLGGPYVFGSPTSMLVRSDEVRKRPMFYNEANPHCDIETCLDILSERDFGFVHQVLTFTRDHPASETTFSSRFGTDYLGTLEHLKKYGRVYLSEKELRTRTAQCWQRYYTFLGAKALHNSDKGFWEYHRNELTRLGYSLSMGKVAMAVAFELLNLTFNPLTTSMKIAAKISHRLHKRRDAMVK